VGSWNAEAANHPKLVIFVRVPMVSDTKLPFCWGGRQQSCDLERPDPDSKSADVFEYWIWGREVVHADSWMMWRGKFILDNIGYTMIHPSTLKFIKVTEASRSMKQSQSWKDMWRLPGGSCFSNTVPGPSFPWNSGAAGPLQIGFPYSQTGELGASKLALLGWGWQQTLVLI
jgi:hypothetical protein